MDGGDAFLGSMRRRPGIDFDDVFGGPPTQSSYSSRRSAEEIAGGLSSSVRETDGGGLQVASLRFSFGDKPVFGEPYCPSPRRRGLSDDFFSDIFRGGGSGGSTPRGPDWDALSSAPGSRVLSPARTVAPRADPPDGFVLSPLSNTTEKEDMVQGSPAFDFSPDNLLSKAEDTGAAERTASEKVLASLAEWERVSHLLHQNELSLQSSLDNDALQRTDDSGSIGTDGNLNQDSSYPKNKTKSNQFHFSIYKWASKGVMLMVPSTPKEKAKTGSRLSGLPVPFVHGADLSLSRKNVSSSDRVFPSEFGKQDAEACRESKITMEFSEAESQSSRQKFKLMLVPTNDKTETGRPVERQMLSVGNETIGDILSKDASDASDLTQEEEIHTLQKLFNLIKEHTGRKDEVGEHRDNLESSLHRTTSARSMESLTEVRWQAVKNMVTDHTDTKNEGIQIEHKSPPGRVKGKVKDFTKISNQDVSCEPMNICEPQSRSIKAMDVENNSMVDFERLYMSKLNWEEISKSDSKDAVQFHEPLVEKFMVEDRMEFDASAEIQQILDYFSQKNEDSISNIGSTSENIEVSNSDTEGINFEVEECMVEEVMFELTDGDDVPQPASNVEEFQNSHAKIREWSSGKEGNIRSLLSTLQYVLWPGSGWKVVPLVDLIESSSVRRAYQRALLFLHPDKLQQRGAPEHQKHIAEKVFDVLQEAWNQFSSVSPI